MTELNQIYKCNVCGNIVEVLHTGAGELVCCGEPMELMKLKTKDEGKEKHVPVIEKNEGKIVVKVGSIEHPMEEDHYIEWIELEAGDKRTKKFLRPGVKPVVEFCVSKESENSLKAKIYCNVHGLW